MSAAFAPSLMTTGIGSLPYRDPDRAAASVLEADVSIPYWPQLPKRDSAEGMVAQFSKPMPCVRMDADEGELYWEPERKYAELERFYSLVLAEEQEPFGLSDARAAGFSAFHRAAQGHRWPYVKGQVTGPITYTTSIQNRDGDVLFSDSDLREAGVKMLARNARWQVDRLRQFAEEAVVVFVDEPVLAAYGSSALASISEQHVHTMLGQIFGAIEEAGGISGMHVCGNSDWGVMSSTGVQVLNFDAYQFGHTMGLYPDAVDALLARGGCIAWGIVPTTADIADAELDSLTRTLDRSFDALTDKGIDAALLRERSLLTPSCGAGSMEVAEAEKVFDLLGQLQARMAGRP
ncbi:MAG: hypothetical protein PVJ27_11960 [Candidatus Brocadiaceae bacterium]|jgi:hypothetical protein